MSRAEPVPTRVAWAVELLDPAPTDRVLEVGCGPGIGAVMVADRLTTGHVTAIDRSATAVERATHRGRAHIEARRLDVRRATLVDLDRAGRPFDKAFAVNVNLFWTSSAEAELAILRAVLGANGSLLLVYEAPGDRASEIAGRVSRTLAAQGFGPASRTGPEPSLVAIVATPL